MSTKPFRNLLGKMSKQRRAKIQGRVNTLLEDMPLQELRKARELTQIQVAEALHIEQAAISKMEHQTDIYVDTLRRFIEAMGGQLEIVAKFPDGAVRISQFQSQRAA